MKQTIDSLLEETENYKEVKSTDNTIVNIKQGSTFNKDLPVMKGNILLNGDYEMKYVVNTLTDPEDREKWDSSLVESRCLRKYSANLILKRYVVKIPVFLMQDREFVEKQVAFRSERGEVYLYSTSVDDSFETLKPNLTRGKTIISGSRITKEESGIRVETISQMDLRFKLPAPLVSGKMADGLERYRMDLINKLNNNI